ncbi:MAG: IS1 family transposase [Methylocella sp.]
MAACSRTPTPPLGTRSDRLLERLKSWKILLYCTGDYQPCESALPAGRHDIGKAQTYHIEQNNSRQRHWFARFKRRRAVVTRSLLMLELAMRLFATFHATERRAVAGNGIIYDWLTLSFT